jgi:hypothetical protein
MSDLPGGRPRPGPRPRPSARPSPRPRVAGSRRDRDEVGAAGTADEALTDDAAADASAVDGAGSADASPPTADRVEPSARKSAVPAARKSTPKPEPTKPSAKAAPKSASRSAGTAAPRRRRSPLVAVLALLCVLALAGAGWLFWERMNPRYVDESVFTATEAGVQALYAYDYRDSEGSVQRKLDVLTGGLREQYETDLSQGGIIQTYEQVSATTSYEVLDVGLQRINDAQDTATLVVFGQYVVKSVNTGEQAAPEGSECQVTPDGAQSCTQTVQVSVVQVDGEWKIDELTLLTTS